MFNFNLRGVGDWLKLGKKGPIIKRDGDKIAYRNSTDTALINVQAKDPVDPQDVITKQYFDDNSSNLPFSVSASLFAQVAYSDASLELKGKGDVDLPQNGLVYAVQIKVTETFDGTNPSATIGTDASNDRLMALDKNDLKEGNIFYLSLSDIFSSETVIKAFVTPDGSTQGRFDATVLYTQSDEIPLGFGSKSYSQAGLTAGQSLRLFGNKLTNNPSALNGLTGSVALWIKYNGEAGSNALLVYGGSSSSRGLTFTINASGVASYRDNSFSSSGSIDQSHDILSSSGIDLFDGEWHLICLTSNLSTDKRKVYVDGNLIPPDVERRAVQADFDGFGQRGNDPSPCQFDWAHAYSFGIELDQAQVTELYNGGVVKNPADLTYTGDVISSWSFGDNAGDNGSTVIDEVGSKNLTVTGNINIIEDHPSVTQPPVGISFNSSLSSSQLTLENNDLTLTSDNALQDRWAWGFAGPIVENATAGKVYVEYKVEALGDTIALGGAIYNANPPASFDTTALNVFFTGEADEGDFYLTNGGLLFNNGGADLNIGSTLAVNDVVTIAVDFTTDTVHCAVNGVWQGTSDPANDIGGYVNNRFTLKTYTYFGVALENNSDPSNASVSVLSTPSAIPTLTGYTYLGS
jgi:hypothetical protein